MTTWDLLVTRGWLFAWMALIPVVAMGLIWVLAMFSDARNDSGSDDGMPSTR